MFSAAKFCIPFLIAFVYPGHVNASSNGIKIAMPSFPPLNGSEIEDTTQGYFTFYPDSDPNPTTMDEGLILKECSESTEMNSIAAAPQTNVTMSADEMFFAALTTKGSKTMVIFAILFALTLLLSVCVIGLFCLFCMISNGKSGSYDFTV